MWSESLSVEGRRTPGADPRGDGVSGPQSAEPERMPEHAARHAGPADKLGACTEAKLEVVARDAYGLALLEALPAIPPRLAHHVLAGEGQHVEEDYSHRATGTGGGGSPTCA